MSRVERDVIHFFHFMTNEVASKLTNRGDYFTSVIVSDIKVGLRLAGEHFEAVENELYDNAAEQVEEMWLDKLNEIKGG